jgi:hypothetical protein
LISGRARELLKIVETIQPGENNINSHLYYGSIGKFWEIGLYLIVGY